MYITSLAKLKTLCQCQFPGFGNVLWLYKMLSLAKESWVNRWELHEQFWQVLFLFL